jgi:hypothetical protein
MLHIYGHTWPVRWGKPGEEKLVKVFSNCRRVELFVNGVSAGVKERSLTNYPAAGLNWQVQFKEGENAVRAVSRDSGPELTDEIRLSYQTTAWGQPARLVLQEIARTNTISTVEVRAFDAAGVPCMDAANLVHFGLAGDGRLLDNLGTAGGSRVVQLVNGRAQIGLELTAREAIISVGGEDLETQFLRVTNAVWTQPVATKNEHGNGKGKNAARNQTTKKPGTAPAVDVAAIDRERILKAAESALDLEPITITAFRAEQSTGGPNDFFSMADYFWPDPAKTNGLPYIERDGESYPGVFSAHRMAIRNLRDAVAALGAAYRLTHDERYATKAAELLRVFFLDPQRRMNPHLEYAQAVLGRSPGRSYGIIDTLHLIEIPPAIAAMQKSPAFTPELVSGLKKWFTEFFEWMLTSKNGRQEAAARNNHSVAFWLQIACFAQFTGDQARLAECRRQFKEMFIPSQMAPDGSFPLELKRTKPYAYSIFQLDNLATLCQVLSTPADNLWQFELPDGRGLRKAVRYLFPYLADKTQWPLKPDVMAWEDWPARQPALLFAGLAFGEGQYLDLWKRLPPEPSNAEVRRNIAITQPLLWLAPSTGNLAAHPR